MRRSATLLTMLVLVAACTSNGVEPSPTATPSPTPTQGTEAPGVALVRATIVVHPDLPGGAQAVRQDVADLDPALTDGVRLRVVAVDDPGFVTDTVDLLVADGHELVCVFGPEAAAAVRDAAVRSPTTRFCAAPATGTLPPNVLGVDVALEEVGYLAGVALAADLDAGPVAVVPSSAAMGAARVRDGLRAGLEAGGHDEPAAVLAPSVANADEAAERTEDLLSRGTAGLFAWAGLLDRDVVAQALATPVTQPTPEPDEDTDDTDDTDGTADTDTAQPDDEPTEPPFAALVGGPALGNSDLPDQVLAIIELRLGRVMAVVLERFRGDWDTSAVRQGVADDVIVATPNEAARTPGVAEALEVARAALRDGAVNLEE
jgi:basic membrane lipoprotein Med (substrate-binding protein (PBP1-ABC) superfamily)